jgi:hypothetical protein
MDKKLGSTGNSNPMVDEDAHVYSLRVNIIFRNPEVLNNLPAIYKYFLALSKHLKKSDIEVIDEKDRYGIKIGDLFISAKDMDYFDDFIEFFNMSVFIHILNVKLINMGLSIEFMFEYIPKVVNDSEIDI